MIAEAGHFALILALATAIVQFAFPLYGAQRADRNLMAMAQAAAFAQFLLIAFAFLALMYAYVTSDFSVRNVWENSHSAKPLLYRISGVWGNHEGSMVLWVLILSVFGAAVAGFGANLPLELKSRVLAIQGLIGAAFLLFIITASNPFLRLDPPPIEGNGLNPILQDPALAFHPPFLYAGYVGLSIAFAFAIATLIDGKIDAAWARWVRPWTLAAWMFLTIGIAMGSWWAYYELGWGGFWFWDPVENASFMPWLAATALLHSAIVVEKRNALKVWTILLAILAFSLSLVGTFLVRSGVLTSVHAFAVDPARGIFILAILSLFIGGALTLFAWRAPALKAGGLFAPISREGGLVLNNLLLCGALAAVFIGTLYPLAIETLTGEKISVGPPYFNLTFGSIVLPLLMLLPLGPFLTWKRADAFAATQRLWVAAAAAIASMVLILAVKTRGTWLVAHSRQPMGTGRSHSIHPSAASGRVGAVQRTAAIEHRHDLCSCGARPCCHRDRCGECVAPRAHTRHEGGRDDGDCRIPGEISRRDPAHRPQLYGRSRPLPHPQRQHRVSDARFGETLFRAWPSADNRSRSLGDARRQSLHCNGRARRRWPRHAHLFPPACLLYMGGCGNHVSRWPHFTFRSPLPHRHSPAGAKACPSGGGIAHAPLRRHCRDSCDFHTAGVGCAA
jgi:cytochrome c biogenesis factor